MLYPKIKYQCLVCGNKSDWYIMPLDEKTKSGDTVRSNTLFRMQCKKCGENYILSFNIQRMERKK